MSKHEAVERAARAALEFGNAADVFRKAMAVAMELNHSDLRILLSLRPNEAMSAGAVATAAGLSPAAATEAIQRLADRGLLIRTRDAVDRRRAAISISAEASDQLARLTQDVRDGGRTLLGRYSVEELATIAQFLGEGRALQIEAASRIRASASE